VTDFDYEHERAYRRTGRWGRAAAGVLFLSASTGRLGLALRSDQVLEPNTYGIVGGAIDPREDKRVAAAREAREEIGLQVDPNSLVLLDTFEDPRSSFRYYTFLAVLPQECPPCFLNWENDAFLWFALNELPPNLHPGVAATLAKPKVLSKLRRTSLPGAGGQPRRSRRSGWSPEDYERAFGPRRR